MYLGSCCAECRKTASGLGVVGWDDAIAFVVTEIVSGALQREAHKRAKQQAWEKALQRIPEDDFIDYAAYVRDQPELYDAWKSGSWITGRGATLPEFGLIHIREFGPRDNVEIKALRPGPRPDPGPDNGFAVGWPTQVLRKLKPLANPVPIIRGVNDMAEPTQRQLLRQQRQAIRREKLRNQRQRAGAKGGETPFDLGQYSPLLMLAAGGAALYFLFGKKSGGNSSSEGGALFDGDE